MKNKFIAFKYLMHLVWIALFTTVQFIVVKAQPTNDQNILNEMEDYSKLLSTSARQKVIQSSRSLGAEVFAANRNTDLKTLSVSCIKNQYPGLSQNEYDALTMLVMFDIYKTGEKELGEIRNEINRINDLKLKQQAYLDKLNKQKATLQSKIKADPNSNVSTTKNQLKDTENLILKQTTKTSLLKINYTRIPKLPLFRDPAQMSASELEQAINTSTANLKTLVDMGQMDQLDLQDAMQKQGQILQLMSNISKMIHDSLKGIIQNLR